MQSLRTCHQRSISRGPASSSSSFVRPGVRVLKHRPAPVVASRSRTVAVEANFFARIGRLFRSFTEGLVSSVEDPEKLLDTVVNDMQSDLIRMKQAGAQVMASRMRLEAKYKQSQTTADEWLRRAELAVYKGEDELAREALKRRKANQEQADSLKTQLQLQQKATDQLFDNTRVLEVKLAEAKSKKDTLKARAASAKTSQQIQEMIGSLNTSSAVAAFEKMEEKVLSMEAQAESTALLVPSDKLEDRFALLEAGTVDDELRALKNGLKAPPRSKPALPEGRPLKDAIDMELEDMRMRMQAR